VAHALNSAGTIAICAVPGSTVRERERARGMIGSGRFLWVDAWRLPGETPAAAAEVCQLLRASGHLGPSATA
jgi:hypothetical protein